MLPQSKESRERDRKLLSFLFANGVSITTLVAVTFYAGSFWSKMQERDVLLERVVKAVEKLEHESMLTRLKIAGYDVDLEHIKRRDLDHFTRDYKARPIPPQ